MNDSAANSRAESETPMLRAIIVLALSFLVVMLDGYDLLCMSFVAPPLAKILNVDVASFGGIFGAGVAGVLIGGLTIGAMGDRFGRKAVLLFSVALFGLFSLMPVFDLTFDHLLVYRFITGLGLGGALPCVSALTAESAPARFRGLFVSLMYGGVATGGVVGGLIASKLIPVHGWQIAFWIGGLMPLALLPVLWIVFRETARKNVPAGNLKGATGRVAALFGERRQAGTLFLWLTSFCALLSFGAIVSWLPVLMTRYDLPLKVGILGPVVINLGGIAGTILVGGALARLRQPAVAVSYLLAGGATVALSYQLGPHNPAFLCILLTGLFLLGANNATNALITNFYPEEIRATGIGWALAAGRVGGIVGPMMGGALLAKGAATSTLLLIMAASAALAGLFMGLFAFSQKKTSKEAYSATAR